MRPAADPKKITTVILDVDGVLTEGSIGYGTGSEHEIKYFNCKDGLGIRLLTKCGIKVGIISGRKCLANRRRGQELGLDFMYEGYKVKLEAFQMLLKDRKLAPENCLYIGDDLIDLPIMHRVGIAVAVGDAVDEVKKQAHWTMSAYGGRGAIREAAERLLKIQGRWEEILKSYE